MRKGRRKDKKIKK